MGTTDTDARTGTARPRAVLLDFDHTLFTFDDSVDWVRVAQRSLGRDLDETAIRDRYERIEAARRWPEVVAEQRGSQCSPVLHRQAHRSWFRRAGIDEALAEAMYARLLSPAGWTPYRDVAVTLAALRAHRVPVAVVSNVGWDIRPTFAHHGFADQVDAFVLSCEQGVEKPNLTMFRVACEQLGVAPEEALMVGDDPVNDGAAVELGARFRLLPDCPPGGYRGLAEALAPLGLATTVG